MDCTVDEYPSNMSSEEEAYKWLPDSIMILMEYLIPNKLKRASLAQCIVQAARPRSVIGPIPFGVGVALEKKFGSKWLLTFLSKLGFSVSPSEVEKYKESAIEHMENNFSRYDQFSPDEWEQSCVQYVADNIDHNSRTLTGHGTFHAMGIIAVKSGSKRSLNTSLRL